IGFGGQAVLEHGFAELSGTGRLLSVSSMVALTAGVSLLMWPAAYHRIVLHGEDDPRLVKFANRVLCVGLAPFARGLGASLYATGERAGGMGLGLFLGVGAAAAGLGAWYVFPTLARRKNPERHTMPKKTATDPAEKIRHVLTEARMVL